MVFHESLLFLVLICMATIVKAQIPCHASQTCCDALSVLAKDKDYNKFVGQWSIENQKSKNAYNCVTDSCVLAYSNAILKHETPAKSCACNSTWIDVDALKTKCSTAGSTGGLICPSDEYLYNQTKSLSVRNLFLNCLPKECTNPSDLKSLEIEATQNPLCKDMQTCRMQFDCP
jgi:hypothetical protein